jgi:HK97 family phage portal protein
MENKLKRIWNVVTEKRTVSVQPTTALGLPYGFGASPLSLQTAMQLSAVYRCVEVISDAIASQTWEYLKYSDKKGWYPDQFDDICYMLNYSPSPSMSRYTLMKTLIAKVLLEGAGYIHIIRNGIGDPVQLELISENAEYAQVGSGTVKIFKRPDSTLFYKVGLPGKEVTIDGEDMIHILNFTYDGIVGVSTLRHAAESMGLAYASESTAKGFFLSGANAAGILQAEGKMTPEKAKAIKDSWAAAFNITNGQPGGIAVMEKGLEFTPVTVNPKDAQMLETRQFNVVEICRFFGVSPSKVFDNENLTYSNIESFQLGFLTDTISPWDAKIESEFNRKLLRPSKRLKTRLNLNIDELLRANLDARANYVSKMFQCGGYTVNEVRRDCGNPLSSNENADKAMVQINMQAVDNFLSKPIDKKVKLKDEITDNTNTT